MEHPFAEQCRELARATLVANLAAINEDGSLSPVEGEPLGAQESGHAALAIGEYFRATGETALEGYDLIDLAARTITAQVFNEQISENGLAYAALGLLSFGPSKERNLVWERLHDETKELLDRRLLARSDYEDHRQAFNIAKAVARYSFGLSKKDETGRLIERFVERINANSTGGFCDDKSDEGCGGVFDIYGILSFVFIRQALQLHANLHLKERKLPSLRTNAEKYLKLLPDLVRHDGLGWSYGENIGTYGQMHCISLILQALRDDWVAPEKRPTFLDLLRRLFHFFFVSYVDQDNGCLIIRDAERSTIARHTTRLANFDSARYLSQWSRLARAISGSISEAKPAPARPGGRFVLFNRGRREQGLFLYHDPKSGLHLQIPLVGNRARGNSDSLSFPHAPGIFDWPADHYLPVLQPELIFGTHRIVPSYYGKGCVTGIGPRNVLYFRYEQPELITRTEEVINGLGSCKVNWTFEGCKISCDYAFAVKSQTQLDQIRLVFPVGLAHSKHRLGTSLRLGDEGLRPTILRDDFHCEWQENEIVSGRPEFRSYWGSLYYYQTLARAHPLVMRPGQVYRLAFSVDPDLALVDE